MAPRFRIGRCTTREQKISVGMDPRLPRVHLIKTGHPFTTLPLRNERMPLLRYVVPVSCPLNACSFKIYVARLIVMVCFTEVCVCDSMTDAYEL